jgi:methyltransferase (TIGR00027 family)
MRPTEPSLTARGAAAHRAAHQVHDGGAIFADPFVRRLLGAEVCMRADQDAADPSRRPLRLFVAARTRFAEEALAASVGRGVRQVVILGAGYDTFALRNPYARLGLQVFEVDHPATQDWKRARLVEAGFVVPDCLTFVAVDFEQQNVERRLAEEGFRADLPSFFSWLGVVPYLRRESVFTILRFIAALPELDLVFDYAEPLENSPLDQRARTAAFEERVAAVGEPLLSFFDPDEIAREVRRFGFTDLEDLAAVELINRFSPMPLNVRVAGGGPHVLHARRVRG